MLKNLFIFLFLLITCSVYAGTPSATDSTTLLMKRPTQYMYKYMNVDTTNFYNASYVLTITSLNTSTYNNCPIGSATTSHGVGLNNIQYVQVGIFGQVPASRALNTSNYYLWNGGSMWTGGISWTSCTSGCCANCPYWVYDYSALRVICAPMYPDWQAGTI